MNGYKINFRKFTFVLPLLLFLFSCSHTGSDSIRRDNLESKFTEFMDVSYLEKAGFMRIGYDNFDLLFEDGFVYIRNDTDRLIVKFKGNKSVARYQARKGQAPGEFATAGELFIFDEKRFGVFDGLKNSLMFFDRDLNYLGERKNTQRHSDLIKNENGFLGKGFYGTKRLAFVNKDLEVVETFFEMNKKLWQNFVLETVKVLDGRTAILSPSVLRERECKLDIFDIFEKKVVLQLKWEHVHSLPSPEQIRRSKNIYMLGMVRKLKSYYVVQNVFLKSLQPIKGELDLLVFQKRRHAYFTSG